MPDFNIKNSWGQKVGSIEQKGPGFLDSLAQIQIMKRSLRFAEREKLVEDTYNDLSAISAHVEGMTSLAEFVNLQGEMDEYIKSLLRAWLDAVEGTPFASGLRKVEIYHAKVMVPLAEEIRVKVSEISSTLYVFNQLDYLLALINQYIVFHNESCERVEAQGLLNIEITDKVFIGLNNNWGKALDDLLDFQKEIVSVASRLDLDEDFDSISKDANNLFAKLPDLENQIENLVNLTNGREKAAERVLASHVHNQGSPSLADELQKLVEMKNAGHLTEEEFLNAKGKLLS